MDPTTSQSGQEADHDLFRPEETVVVSHDQSDVPETETQSEHTEPTQSLEYHPVSETTPKDEQSQITWIASEYASNQKTSAWYGLLIVVAIIIGALAWLLTRDIFSTLMVLISLTLLGIYAGRPPREQRYTLDNSGLTIGSRHYTFHNFRSFALLPAGTLLSIELMPLKRLATYTIIYFNPKDGERITSFLSSKLPMEEPRETIADHLMRRIQF